MQGHSRLVGQSSTKGAAMTKLSVGLQEAQELTGISHFTFRRMVRLGKIKAVRVGRRVLIPVSELEKLVNPGATSATGRKKS
jgi:excisionase family DNA binding protein